MLWPTVGERLPYNPDTEKGCKVYLYLDKSNLAFHFSPFTIDSLESRFATSFPLIFFFSSFYNFSMSPDIVEITPKTHKHPVPPDVIREVSSPLWIHVY